jgi:hypothetical protein
LIGLCFLTPHEKRQICSRLKSVIAASISRSKAASSAAIQEERPRRFLDPRVCCEHEYHTGLEAYFSSPKGAVRAKSRFSGSLANAKAAQEAAAQAFPHPVDAIGGEVGATRHYTEILVRSIEAMRKKL